LSIKPKISSVSSKILLSTVIAGIGLFAAVLGFKAWKFLGQPIPQLESSKQQLPDIPGFVHLKNVPVVEDVHLLDGNFKIVRRMNEIPDACISPFESSFLTINGHHPEAGEVRFANPGEPFNWSDVIEEELPFRRLEFSGLSTAGCFIHYQSGGQPHTFCLAVVDTTSHGITIGEYQRAARDLDDLRRLIDQRRSGDGDGC
jgi:hypothetical protein